MQDVELVMVQTYNIVHHGTSFRLGGRVFCWTLLCREYFVGHCPAWDSILLDTVLQREYFAGYSPGDSTLQSLDTVQQREYFAGHCPAENIVLDTVLGIVFCWTCTVLQREY